MEQDRRTSRASSAVYGVAVTGLWGVLGLGGIALVIVGLLDAELLAARVDRLAPDGRAERWSPAALAAAQRRCLSAGAAWILVSICVFRWRGALRSFAAAIGAELATALSSGRRAVRGLVVDERAHAVLLVAFVLAFSLQAASVIGDPLMTDEAKTFLSYAAKPLHVTVSHYDFNNHILHSVLVKASCALFGDGLAAIRLPALAGGLLLLVATYVALRIHVDRWVALSTVGVLGTSRFTAYAATNARGHVLVAALFVVLLAIAPALRGPRARLGWTAFASLGAAGLFVAPTMVFPLAILVVWVVASTVRDVPAGRRIGAIGALAGAIGCTGLLAALSYTPAFVASGLEAVTGDRIASAARHTDIDPFLGTQYTGLAHHLWRVWSYDQSRAVAFTLLIGFLIGPWFSRSVARFGNRLLIAVLIGVCGVIVLLGHLPPKWIFVFAYPVYVGLACVGVVGALGAVASWAPSRTTRPALVVAATLLMAAANSWTVATHPDATRFDVFVGYPDTLEAVAFLSRELGDDDGVVVRNIMSKPLEYHYRRATGVSLPRVDATSPTLPDRVYLVAMDHRESAASRAVLDGRGFAQSRLVRELPSSTIVLYARRPGPRGR